MIKLNFLSKGLIAIAFSCMLFVGCTKNEVVEPQNEVCRIPEAFPGVVGETVRLDLSNGNELYFQKIGDKYVLEGDIVYTAEQFAKLQENARLKGTAAISSLRWPSKKVYYKINANVPADKVTKINNAIADMESQTNLDFIVRGTQANYIEFINGTDAMWSTGVGMLGGKQQICFADWGTKGSCIHEMCHAVGMWHEQSRQDRGTYINIMWANIQESKKSQFNKYPAANGDDTGSFDFNSIMIYPCYNGFAIDTSKPTMTKKDGTTWGQKSVLSSGDKAALKTMY